MVYNSFKVNYAGVLIGDFRLATFTRYKISVIYTQKSFRRFH